MEHLGHRALKEIPVHQEDYKDHLVCLVQQAILELVDHLDREEILAHKELKDHQEILDYPGRQEIQDCLDHLEI